MPHGRGGVERDLSVHVPVTLTYFRRENFELTSFKRKATMFSFHPDSSIAKTLTLFSLWLIKHCPDIFRQI